MCVCGMFYLAEMILPDLHASSKTTLSEREDGIPAGTLRSICRQQSAPRSSSIHTICTFCSVTYNNTTTTSVQALHQVEPAHSDTVQKPTYLFCSSTHTHARLYSVRWQYAFFRRARLLVRFIWQMASRTGADERKRAKVPLYGVRSTLGAAGTLSADNRQREPVRNIFRILNDDELAISRQSQPLHGIYNALDDELRCEPLGGVLACEHGVVGGEEAATAGAGDTSAAEQLQLQVHAKRSGSALKKRLHYHRIISPCRRI